MSRYFMSCVMSYSLQQINAFSADEFVAAFGAIYEHSPWVAEQSATARPFDSVDQMLATMQAVVANASHDMQLSLIRAHPELQGKPATILTAASTSEQKSAGLDQCSPQEMQQLAALNRAYRDKFGFPFIIAVRGLTRSDVIVRMSQRLTNQPAAEFETCLAQIYRIASLRLATLCNNSFAIVF
jgi:2-oxo-4-hydroxy-4-carboxy-5-ureidoimidazoline decarboxylase